MKSPRTINQLVEDADYLMDAIHEVRNSEKEASEYEFWSEIQKNHSAPSRKGNDGLGNFVAYMASYREEGELQVDDELVREADRRLTEEHESGRDRTRFNNIVFDSENRPGTKNSIYDNGVDGHQRLIEWAGAVYESAGQEERGREKIENILKDTDLSLNDTNWKISDSRKTGKFILANGGEIIMTDEEYESADELLADVESGEFDNYDDVVDTVHGLDLGEESEVYVLGESMMMMASGDSRAAERKSSLLLQYKRATDHLVSDLDSQFGELRSHYIEDMGRHAVAHRNNGERMSRVSDNLDEGIENLSGLNEEISSTLDESGVPELTDLKDSLGSSYDDSEE